MVTPNRHAHLPYELEDPTNTRLLAVDAYEAPADIRLEDGGLHWLPIEKVHVVRPVAPTMLLEFLNLADGKDADVLEYAKRWGVLYMCKEHSLPNCHTYCTPYQCEVTEEEERMFQRMLDQDGPIVQPVVDKYRPLGEPVTEWRRWSRIARTILDIREKLSEGKIGSDDQWRGLAKDRWLDPHPENHLLDRAAAARNGRETAIAYEKYMIANSISLWLKIGDVHPRMTWDGVQPEFTLTGSGRFNRLHPAKLVGVEMFGALAVQLLENAGRYVITCCSGCLRFYDATPSNKGERRPKAGQARYCKECRDSNAAVRLSQQKRAGKAHQR
jgi:hypothetical protein